MTFKGTLRPYQVAPVETMKERGRILLAAEQGTGKTVCTIATIEDLFDNRSILAPGLIVALSTIKTQWAEKIEEFTEGSSTPLVIPSGPARFKYYQRAREWEGDYVILHYEQVVNDWDQVATLPRGFLVVDEASFIRGFRSNRSQAVKALSTDVRYCYALTGTPIENGRPEELFSIMEFVDPDVFGRHDLFDRTFIKRDSGGRVSYYRNLPTFHKVLETATIRFRTSDPEVAPYMPDVVANRPMRIPLDRAGCKLYETVAAELLGDLRRMAAWGGTFDLAANYGRAANRSGPQDMLRGSIGQKLLLLQMLCDHPQLLRESAHRWQAKPPLGSQYIASWADAGELDGLTETPKLDHCIRWVGETLERDPRNKVVVFTRYVDMVDLFGARLKCDLWLPFTGTRRMTAKERDANLKRFQTDPKVRVLVSTDAGGFGLDIPQANHVLNFDLPDGAGAADQRDTRIVRTSSEFERVYQNWALVRNSIEEYRLDRLAQKRAVRDAFIDKRGLNPRGAMELTASSLTTFLESCSIRE